MVDFDEDGERARVPMRGIIPWTLFLALLVTSIAFYFVYTPR